MSNIRKRYGQECMNLLVLNLTLPQTTFNEHFCSIHKVFKDPAQSPSNIHFSRLEYMTQRKLNNQHFSIPYITQLIHLDISKSTGSDQISAKFLKMAAPIIAPALTQIFNLSISKAGFPSPFNLAREVPIHKKVPNLTISTIGQYLYFQLLHLYWNDM